MAATLGTLSLPGAVCTHKNRDLIVIVSDLRISRNREANLL